MPQQIALQTLALEADRPLVHGVSLTLKRGRVLALVGGSGSGKSLTCAAALGILPAGVRQTAGVLLADGRPVSPGTLRGIKIATIMQNPRSAFNPLHTMATRAGDLPGAGEIRRRRHAYRGAGCCRVGQRGACTEAVPV